MNVMSKLLTTLSAAVALTAVFAGCAEADTPKPTVALENPATPNVFSPQGSDEPLPADQVFIPDAHIEDGALLYRIQLLPGYYLYKNKIDVRSLSDGTVLDDHVFIEEWSGSEVVVDEWFGEQEVYFNEAHGIAQIKSLIQDLGSMEIELSYQGCKKDGICYMPQAKVLSVDFPARLESAADDPE
jgi:thiol:disulfide interchange protein DsbD